MKKTYVIGGAAVLTAALLAGCNSNGDDGSVPAAGPTTTTLTVTPSLGRISNGRVVLRNAATGNQIGTPRNLAGGSASFPDVPLGIPVVAEIQPLPGATDITYFDEGTGTNHQITGADLTNFHFRAALGNVVPGANLGITALTEAAFRNLPAGGGLTAAQIDNANNTIRNELRRVGLIPTEATFDITQAPALVGAAGDYAGLANDLRGQYAALLAMWANAVHNRIGGNAPALDFLNNLASDLADGNLNGSGGAAFNFDSAQFDAALNQAAAQLRSHLPNLGGLVNGITFSGGVSVGGKEYGTIITTGNESHTATTAAVVTVNNIKTVTWSDGTGALSVAMNATTNVPLSLTFTSDADAGFLTCSGQACSGVTVDPTAKTVSFSNVSFDVVSAGSSPFSVISGTLSYDIATPVTGGINITAGTALTVDELKKLAGTYPGSGTLMVGQTFTTPNCQASIDGSTGSLAVTGGAFSMTVAPTNQSIVSDTTVNVGGQQLSVKSVTLYSLAPSSVEFMTASFNANNKLIMISGTTVSPATFTASQLTCNLQ
ncbi:MAG: hypothetical protein Q7T36_07685 [Fluviicoccus sp.]|uniref:hypothetical protein n=1 Tax=Fluviicoccus sp. TaxID=2003552 RepID=UPI0027279176|nr:hypothetical protein [Fluviicoccus sp.]MDO8330333.1 hypothetical protein [Fluviicoccus sp.]